MAEAWSFLDFVGAYTGPFGTFELTSEGISTEGVTIAFAEDSGSMVIGAKGDGMHNLRANASGTATLNYMKTGRINAILSQLYAFEKSSSANFGKGTMTFRNTQTGDYFLCEQCGIRKFPDSGNSVDGNGNAWVFNVIRITPTLGDGNPELLENSAI